MLRTLLSLFRALRPAARLENLRTRLRDDEAAASLAHLEALAARLGATVRRPDPAVFAGYRPLGGGLRDRLLTVFTLGLWRLLKPLLGGYDVYQRERLAAMAWIELGVDGLRAVLWTNAQRDHGGGRAALRPMGRPVPEALHPYQGLAVLLPDARVESLLDAVDVGNVRYPLTQFVASAAGERAWTPADPVLAYGSAPRAATGYQFVQCAEGVLFARSDARSLDPEAALAALRSLASMARLAWRPAPPGPIALSARIGRARQWMVVVAWGLAVSLGVPGTLLYLYLQWFGASLVERAAADPMAAARDAQALGESMEGAAALLPALLAVEMIPLVAVVLAAALSVAQAVRAPQKVLLDA